MYRTLSIIKKNFKLLLRSKTSSLIVILAPIILTILIGLAFKTSGLYGIKIGVYSDSYSDLTGNIISNLEDQNFRVIKTSSEQSCLESLKLGEVHLCAIFPPNLEIREGVQNEIAFYADYSQINLAYLILDSINRRITEQTEEISLGLTTQIVNKLKTTQENLVSQQPLVEDIKSKNDALFVSAGELLQGLNTVNLLIDFNKFNLSNVKEEITNIKNTNNLSDSDVSTLITLIDTLQTDFTSLEGEILTANTVIVSTSTGLDSIKSTSSNIKSTTSQVGSNIVSINENINTLAITDPSTIVSPITTTIKPITTEKTNLDFILPTLVVMIIMFVSILLASTLIISEKISKAHFRNFITPTNDFVFILGTFLTAIIIILIQLIVFLGISSFFISTNLIDNLLHTSLIMLSVISLFTLLGMLIGYLFASEETSVLASISFSSLALFFSNTVLPIESMPTSIQNIAFYNPFVISEFMLKRSILFETQISSLLNDFYYVLAYIGVVLIIVILAQKFSRKFI